MAITSWFGFASGRLNDTSELPEIFPLKVSLVDFVKADIFATYSKILTDVVDKSHGITEKVEPLMWDNCVQDDASWGLVSLLAEAMAEMNDLFLVYKPATNVLRKATAEESQKIRTDYQTNNRSDVGVFISFKNYRRSDILNIYSSMEYCSVASLYKSANVSKAVQIKINDLRASVSLQDSAVAKEQGKRIATALQNGKDVMLDSKDSIETSTPDVSPTKEAISLTDSKKAFYLGLPQSYISGVQSQGLSNTGEGDMRAVERGLKQYFTSIFRPAMKAIFGITVKWQSQDFRNMSAALEALKTFDMTSDAILSQDQKINLVNRLFDIEEKDNKPDLRKLAEEEVDRLNGARAAEDEDGA